MLLLIILYTSTIFDFSECFKPGFVASATADGITHYAMTECALIRIASNYLKKVYSTPELDSIATATNLCPNAKSDIDRIHTEAERLSISSNIPNVIFSISSSNVLVDLIEPLSSRSHFDDESFTEASGLVNTRIEGAIQEIQNDDLASARTSFGKAMHTTQDFYSHSNWIEMGKTQPNLYIGTGYVLGKYAPISMPTCINCTNSSCALSNILPNILSDQWLTSGYFSLNIFSGDKPNGKCSHGGISDQTLEKHINEYGINKDDIHSDHGSFHYIAAQVAYEATLASLQSVWNRVGDKLFGRFLGFDTTSLAIAIDITGSMGPYIQLVKQMAIAIVESTTGENARLRPHKYILSPFNDPTTGPLTVTDDPSVLIDAISSLTADGGGDVPELYYQGLNAALSVCERDSYLYTFTDAPAKDYYLRNQVLQRAIDLNIRIYSFYAGSPYYGRRKRTNNNKRQSFSYDDELGRLDGSNGNDIATATGGFTIGILSGDANATAAYVLRRLENRQSLLIKTLSQQANFTFLIDNTISNLNIDITSTNFLTGSILLIDPNGKQFPLNETASSNYFRLYSMSNLTYGQWTLVSSYQTNHNIELSGSSSVSCSTILATKEKREETVDDYVPFFDVPLINQTDLVLLTTCENLPFDIENTTILLTNRVGTVIDSLQASKYFLNRFATPLVIPQVDFRVLTIIDLVNKTRLQRQSTSVISSSFISIEITNQPYILLANNSINITFIISNKLNQTLNISLCITDTLNLFNQSIQCQKSYFINSFNQINDQITVSNQSNSNLTNATDTTSSTFTFSISVTNPDEINSEKLTSYATTTLYIIPEVYIEAQLPTEQPNASSSSTTTATTIRLKEIFLIPICS